MFSELSRHEVIELLNEHLHMQGKRIVPLKTKLTTLQLRKRLLKIEEVALEFCDMPHTPHTPRKGKKYAVATLGAVCFKSNDRVAAAAYAVELSISNPMQTVEFWGPTGEHKPGVRCLYTSLRRP